MTTAVGTLACTTNESNARIYHTNMRKVHKATPNDFEE